MLLLSAGGAGRAPRQRRCDGATAGHGGRREQKTHSFGTTIGQLELLADWLLRSLHRARALGWTESVLRVVVPAKVALALDAPPSSDENGTPPTSPFPLRGSISTLGDMLPSQDSADAAY
jgi:hypothetical protein